MRLVKLFFLLFFSYASNFLKAEDEIKIGLIDIILKLSR